MVHGRDRRGVEGLIGSINPTARARFGGARPQRAQPAGSGAGERLIEKHGARTRQSWRKLHIGMDAGTGQIIAAALTTREVDVAVHALNRMLSWDAQLPSALPERRQDWSKWGCVPGPCNTALPVLTDQLLHRREPLRDPMD